MRPGFIEPQIHTDWPAYAKATAGKHGYRH